MGKIDLYKFLKSQFKLNKTDIDNAVFKFHYKVTFPMLLLFAALITFKQYVGDPIDCIVDNIPQEVMDTYCWIYSTFTIVTKMNGKVGKDVLHPGVSYFNSDDEIKYYKYYQWVCFVLFLQAILFYIPRYIWKTCEGGLIKALTLKVDHPIVDHIDIEKSQKNFVEYFTKNIKSHNWYFRRYFLCEFLNFVNVFGQFFFIDYFLNGGFWSYNKIFDYRLTPNDGNDPMATMFPKVTKCTFNRFGASGGIQKFDGLCILPVNIINEKIYAILWLWFIILIIASGVTVLWRFFNIFIYCTEKFDACYFFNPHNEHFISVIKKGSIGDWFILLQVKQNMDSVHFISFVEKLDEEL